MLFFATTSKPWPVHFFLSLCMLLFAGTNVLRLSFASTHRWFVCSVGATRKTAWPCDISKCDGKVDVRPIFSRQQAWFTSCWVFSTAQKCGCIHRDHDEDRHPCHCGLLVAHFSSSFFRCGPVCTRGTPFVRLYCIVD